ncbi:hypothetical protein [Mycobacterium sp.]|uniref:hypothetical protein n=1 Tax=Mycobacterium sp. TaxID=1785 RepID=UPI003D0BBD9F
MDNPYAGQANYEEAWAQGFDYGTNNPNDDQPVPPDFSGLGLDQETTNNVSRVWLEGALAGREAAAKPATGYDAATDTFIGAADDFPALTLISQHPDFDDWLSAIGVDPAVFTDDPVA